MSDSSRDEWRVLEQDHQGNITIECSNCGHVTSHDMPNPSTCESCGSGMERGYPAGWDDVNLPLSSRAS